MRTTCGTESLHKFLTWPHGIMKSQKGFTVNKSGLRLVMGTYLTKRFFQRGTCRWPIPNDICALLQFFESEQFGTISVPNCSDCQSLVSATWCQAGSMNECIVVHDEYVFSADTTFFCLFEVRTKGHFWSTEYPINMSHDWGLIMG